MTISNATMHKAMYECNGAWTRPCEHERGIRHVAFMIRVTMNNRCIMYFSVYALNIVWLLEDIYFCCAVLTPSSKCKWPRFFQPFFPTVPKLVSQKKRGEMLFLFVCKRLIRARGPLFASFGATAVIADSLASTVAAAPTHFSCGCGPRDRLQPATGPLPRALLSPSAYLKLKTQGNLKAHCEWANSLSSKGAKRMFINYLDSC